MSLVPSLTELLFELGLAASVVGRTGFCVHPHDSVRRVPKVGGTKDVRVETVRALAPTHLIVNIDENGRDMVGQLAEFVPNVVVTHPCVPEHNLALYRLLGGIFGRAGVAEQLCAELQHALAAAREVALSFPPENVLYLIWRKPWMTVSRETYIAAMLAAVGWHTLPAQAAVRYPAFDWSDFESAKLSRVFLSSEPFRFRERHVAEVERHVSCPVLMIDGEMASWYGSRAIAGLHYLAGLRRDLAAMGSD